MRVFNLVQVVPKRALCHSCISQMRKVHLASRDRDLQSMAKTWHPTVSTCRTALGKRSGSVGRTPVEMARRHRKPLKDGGYGRPDHYIVLSFSIVNRFDAFSPELVDYCDRIGGGKP